MVASSRRFNLWLLPPWNRAIKLGDENSSARRCLMKKKHKSRAMRFDVKCASNQHIYLANFVKYYRLLMIEIMRISLYFSYLIWYLKSDFVLKKTLNFYLQTTPPYIPCSSEPNLILYKQLLFYLICC